MYNNTMFKFIYLASYNIGVLIVLYNIIQIAR